MIRLIIGHLKPISCENVAEWCSVYM